MPYLVKSINYVPEVYINNALGGLVGTARTAYFPVSVFTVFFTIIGLDLEASTSDYSPRLT